MGPLKTSDIRIRTEMLTSGRESFNSTSDLLTKHVANEECLLKAKGKIESTSAKEAIWTEALAEHLLSKLAPSGSYKIDHHRTGNGPYKQCRCGCGTAIKYGPTGIGHGAVWHGFVDIILSACPVNPDKDPVCTANVIPSENLDDESLESLTGGDQLSDDLQAKSEIKLNINSTENQTVAQTIVFALAQNQIHRNMRNLFIPNIVIDKESFIIIMYEAEKDILVWSVPFRLWACDKPCLQLSSVIALWMVLHYRQFCSGGDIFDEGHLEKIQAHFLKYADPRKLEIYKRHLEIGKTVFETQGESLEYLDKDFTIQDFDDSFYKV